MAESALLATQKKLQTNPDADYGAEVAMSKLNLFNAVEKIKFKATETGVIQLPPRLNGFAVIV